MGNKGKTLLPAHELIPKNLKHLVESDSYDIFVYVFSMALDIEVPKGHQNKYFDTLESLVIEMENRIKKTIGGARELILARRTETETDQGETSKSREITPGSAFSDSETTPAMRTAVAADNKATRKILESKAPGSKEHGK